MQTYETHDIVLAATLKISGCQLDKITVSDNGQGLFYFVNVPTKLLDDFDMDKSSVEPKIFNQTVRNLITGVKRMSERSN